jgi:hypothetical protein
MRIPIQVFAEPQYRSLSFRGDFWKKECLSARLQRSELQNGRRTILQDFVCDYGNTPGKVKWHQYE